MEVPGWESEPYEGMFVAVEARVQIALENAVPFDCRRSAHRRPRETKGAEYRETTAADGNDCRAAGPCC